MQFARVYQFGRVNGTLAIYGMNCFNYYFLTLLVFQYLAFNRKCRDTLNTVW